MQYIKNYSAYGVKNACYHKKKLKNDNDKKVANIIFQTKS